MHTFLIYLRLFATIYSFNLFLSRVKNIPTKTSKTFIDNYVNPSFKIICISPGLELVNFVRIAIQAEPSTADTEKKHNLINK